MELGAGALAALARKYEALIELRGARDRRGAGPAPDGATAQALRDRLRALAGEFPGCLRELDTVGAPELQRRADSAAQAASGGAPEPWLLWIAGYHALMRAALHVKKASPDAPGATLALTASAEAGITVDAAFIAAARRPAHGRLGVVVLRALGAAFNVATAQIAGTLFPPRRPPPYRL